MCEADAEHAKREAKTLATLQAALALRGHTVHELANGGIIVSRWTFTRHLKSLSELATFARQIGAVAQ